MKLLASPRFKMIVAGGVSLAISYLTFLFLIIIGVHYLIASVANFFTYWIINFLLNKYWAFRSAGNGRRQAGAHLSLHLGNQFFIMAGLYVLVEFLKIHPAWSQIIMQILATIAVFIITPIIFSHKAK